jgi:dipeptidyl aminopeptidase/acylaminoacyl peptidase
MTKLATAFRSLFFLAPAALLAAYLGLPGGAVGPVPAGTAEQSAAPAAGIELPCHRIPNLPEAAEWSFTRIGSARKQITDEEGTHWAPYPAPDGRHFVYVRVLTEPGGRLNWEIYLRDLATGEERRLTYDPAFDGFPSISADGQWMTFSSSRGGKPGERALFQHIMDISSLGLGPR